MDVYKALSELYEEKKRLDAAILVLEARMRAVAPANKTGGRRGRKSMSMEEREQVSVRMSRYWERRRALHKLSNSGESRLSTVEMGAIQNREVTA